jgi:PAS domain S-box-containing protein
MEHPIPTAEEVVYDGGIMITETDLQGRITFANRKFQEMSAYSKVELLGQSHSIVRHPDMPSCCFKNMWETVRNGETWKGYVKNLRKDGAFYWAVVYVSPKINAVGETIGYIAARKPPEPKTLEAVKTWYAELTDREQCPENCEQVSVANMMEQELAEAR